MRVALSSLPLLLLPSYISASTFDCKEIAKDNVKWNFGKLGGIHEVSWERKHGRLDYRTSFKINICEALKPEDEKERDECKEGTRICATEKHYEGEKLTETVGSWPIVRHYIHDGASIDPKFTRMKSESVEEGETPLEGVIAELGGGTVDGGKKQKARINFTCLPKEGSKVRKLLGETDDEDKEKDDKGDDSENEPKLGKGSKTHDGAGGSIEFVSYDEEVLILDWFTPYACENAASMPEKDKEPDSDGNTGKSGGWGFFSWFFFIIFMLLIVFVAFTAWVNYTKNGARGCDLLPFSDTLRDLPYILGDWWRKIASTIGGSGTRGGYSAV